MTDQVRRIGPFATARWAPVLALADAQGGVLSRPQLYAHGVSRAEVRVQLRAGRWQRLTDQAIALHNGEVSDEGHRWAAVIQGGPRAQLDGAASLVASGLERFTIERIRVSVPRGARVRRCRRYDIRQTRRWSADDRVPWGIPRTTVPVAAIRAALWAVSDKQATYVLSLVVQQGLATPEQLGEQLLRIRRDRRRLLLHAVVNDLLDGARSLGELDVVRELRRRGLPAPQQQVLRRGRDGRYYLDLYWPELGVVVEIDGIHHAWAENVVGDALRQNSLTLQHDVVLRLPLLGLRLQPEEFFAQIAGALAAGAARRAA
jgi:very-short-patch-repair endonuclease